MASLTPGRAAPAAHPQTEFTIIRVVPFELMARSTASGVVSSSKPTVVSSAFIGFTIASGYIKNSLGVKIHGLKLRNNSDKNNCKCRNNFTPLHKNCCHEKQFLLNLRNLFRIISRVPCFPSSTNASVARSHCDSDGRKSCIPENYWFFCRPLH